MQTRFSCALRCLPIIIGFSLTLLPWSNTTAAADFTDSVRFFVIEEYLSPLANAPLDSLPPGIDPFIVLAANLAARYDTMEHGKADPVLPPGFDPLRIPLAFNRTIPRSGKILTRLSESLTRHGLQFEIEYPADFTEAIQLLARKVSSGHPIVVFNPAPILLFGYDAREDDPFLYAWQYRPKGQLSILAQSRLRDQWWLWEPDPRSTVMLEIGGIAEEQEPSPPPKEYLTYILQTARTDTTTGQVSYIRPILALIDSLEESTAPPASAIPLEDEDDPYYLHRARWQRRRFEEYLDTLAPLVRDSAVVTDLRLARYSCGKSAEAFTSAAQGLYGAGPLPEDSAARAEFLFTRWVEYRLEAAELLTEVLRWERQMLEALQAITEERRPFTAQ